MTNAAPNPGKKVACAILLGGLISGILDISYVLIFYGFRGASSLRILQGIAVSVQGRSAFDGGTGSAVLGLTLHFAVAFSAAALFQVLVRAAPVFARRPLVGGILYGASFYLLMNVVVLRFTLIPVVPFPPASWPVILPAHLFCVGLPIAFVARRFVD
jgi:hypothetical protein